MTPASLIYSTEWVSQHNCLRRRFLFKSSSPESAYFKATPYFGSKNCNRTTQLVRARVLDIHLILIWNKKLYINIVWVLTEWSIRLNVFLNCGWFHDSSRTCGGDRIAWNPSVCNWWTLLSLPQWLQLIFFSSLLSHAVVYPILCYSFRFDELFNASSI